MQRLQLATSQRAAAAIQPARDARCHYPNLRGDAFGILRAVEPAAHRAPVPLSARLRARINR
jgi:hypothetical protein